MSNHNRVNHHLNNHDHVTELRARISKALPRLDTPEYHSDWWLLGTSGCHLCTKAETLMMHFQAVQPITYQHVDIADFDEDLMMEFATTIPVLLTPFKRLNYPFSVMDVQQLFLSETAK